MSTRQNLQDQIIQKAWEDAEFKKQLIANPKAAVKEAFGVDLPDAIEVEVVEESAAKFYLVLPESPSAVKADLHVAYPRWPNE
ncbi:NHLP leader peptide family RiPP precursor [Paenibacillus sinopodophylli]|uniref:NHLP leader peptide family RiPP precursor n=1 Tax=Paenibacillus sinopodophylli TaxID=1837342 RepID=UPI001FE8BDA5|nr:NHLP leader peptide family RiPP precursor [Paenibacillus sinopodophylli]